MVERAGGSSEPLESLPFEDALKRLEDLVGRLEHGELSLEAALAAFENGVQLARRCAADLDAAERRIEELVRRGGEWLKRPLDAAAEEAE
jgi:exodeoxyribonuclease VII small subunit